MFAIMGAALIGAPVTTVLLWSHGPGLALLCAPLGGSTAGLAAALCLAFLRRDHAPAAVRVRPAPIPVQPPSLSR